MRGPCGNRPFSARIVAAVARVSGWLQLSSRLRSPEPLCFRSGRFASRLEWKEDGLYWLAFTNRLIAIRVDPDVLERFRKEAKRRKVGYQTLINRVLAEYVENYVA